MRTKMKTKTPRRTATVRVAVVALLAGGAGACAAIDSLRGPQAEVPSVTAAPPSGHSLHSERLERAMRAFDDSVREHIPAHVDLHDRWAGAFVEIAEAARDVQISAVGLKARPPEQLGGDARAQFVALADALARAAARLELGAAASDGDATEEARRDVAASCGACHTVFRPDAGGIPDAFR